MNATRLELADPARTAEQPGISPAAAVSAGIPRAAARSRIVLIEDSRSDAYLVKLALDRAQLNAELIHFSESEKAIAWFAAIENDSVPDLLVLDLNIPRRDGFEVLSALRTMSTVSGMPVMILTSSISPEDRRRAAEAGVRRFVSKPMMLEDFLRDVAAAVRETMAGGGQTAA